MTREFQSEDKWGGSLRIGSHLRGYIIENVLGQGGYGIVYRCRHVELGTTVAIKEYLPNELAVRVDGRVRVRNRLTRLHFEDGLRRFKEEALRLVEFTDHPNIVSCHDFFRLNGTAYSVMDYEVGLPLSKLLQVRESRHRPFEENDLLAIVIPLLDGLKRLHNGGVIHRDIKPSNILIRFADGQPVLIDFGSAKHSVALHTKSYAPFTPGYAPLELLADGELGPWSDIYSVGAIMWRMATGGDPAQPVRVERRASAIVHGKDDPMPSARQVQHKQNSGDDLFRTAVLEAIDRCLTVNHSDRVQNCEDLIRLLQLEDSVARSCTTSTRSLMFGTQLHFEAWSGNSTDITEVVASGADMAARDTDGRTPLHWAAEAGNIETLKQLLTIGAAVDVTCHGSDTSLHVASQNGHSKCIEILCEFGCNIEATNRDWETPLHVAARNGHLNCIEALCASTCDTDNTRFPHFIDWTSSPCHRSSKPMHYDSSNGRTALHLAAENGHTKCVEALISAGADLDCGVDGRIPWGENVNGRLEYERHYDNDRSPLHLAAQTGSLECVIVLIREGADVTRAANNWLTPLDVAIEHGRLECFQPLVDAVVRAGSFVEPIDLCQAIPLGLETEDIYARNRALFKAYANALVRLRDAREQLLTAAYERGYIDSLVRVGLEFDREWADRTLLDAAADGKPEYVGALLKAGIPVDVTDEQGLSALLLAAKHGHSHCIEVICKEGTRQAGGIDVDAIDEQGRGALLLAAKHGYHDCVRALCHEGVGVTNEQNRGALLLAAKHGYWDCVQELCDAGARIGFHNYAVQSALHCALYVAHEVDWPRLIDWLIRSDVDINVRDEYGRKALHIAAVRGHIECVSALLAAGGIDVDAIDEQGRSAALLAAQHGHWDCVRALCYVGAQVKFHNDGEQTVLHSAVYRTHEDDWPRLIDWLVRHGAHINARDEYGQTALHIAAVLGRPECVSALVQAGVDVNATDAQGRSALLLAAKHRHPEFVGVLRQPGVDAQGRSALEFAAKHGDWDCVRALCDAGVELWPHNYWVHTVLECASKCMAHEVDWPRLVDWLIESDADINAEDNYGWTALHRVSCHGDPECVSALLDAGADINAGDVLDNSPLLLAAQHGHWDCVRALCDLGAQIETRNGAKQTVLDCALYVLCKYVEHEVDWARLIEGPESRRLGYGAGPGHDLSWPRLVDWIIESSDDIDAKSESGWTALHVAAVFGHQECVSALLEAGADINPGDVLDNSVLLLAAMLGHWHCVQFLCDAGAQIALRNDAGQTVWHRALFVSQEYVAHDVDWPRLIAWLIESGADIDAEDAYGRTILHTAGIEGHLDLFDQLVRSGADVGVTDIKGRSALDYALRNTGDEWTEVLGSSGGRHSRGRQETPHSSQ